MERYFLTTDRCNEGKRGIFCDSTGGAFPQDKPHTKTEMWDILGAFYMVLAPQSQLLKEEEVAEYTNWIPYAEYTHQFGVALKDRTIKEGG